ncbi:MAG TPA: phosphodiester glycosidase family protein [Candidatus Angelobacter sp.]
MKLYNAQGSDVDNNSLAPIMSNIKACKPIYKRPWVYSLTLLLPTILVIHFALLNAFGLVASAQKEQPSSVAPGTTSCVSTLDPSLSLRCVSFSGHLYAIADIDLRLQKIVFTVSDNGKKESFPQMVSNLSSVGINPLLVTNAGIYGVDNHPLGLLISPKGKLHDANPRMDKGEHGNFSWDSAIFQISDDGIAAIVPADAWQDSRHVVAATQSGPQLASAGKINQSFQAQSKWSYRRTAIGVDQANRKLVHLVVSREPVTLFELAAFMVNELHCSEALHLDGDLSAFYVPSAHEKFLFSDPGERIVTTLSIIDQKRKFENNKPSGSPPKR